MSMLTKTEEIKQQNPTQETLDLYRRRRQESMAIVHRFVKNFNKEVLLQSAKQLGIYYKKTIAVETEQALDVLFNHTIFHYLHNDIKMIDRFAREAAIAQKFSQDKLTMINVLQNASYGILTVKETLPFGGVYVEDSLHNKAFLLMDEGFSFSTAAGCMIATTYVTFPEFSMTTGAALPITGHADDIVTLVEELNLDHYIFSKLPVKKQMKFISVLTQYCLEHGALDRIGYVEQQAMMRDLLI